jgi:membrane fusion protein (multidrug efflux system)
MKETVKWGATGGIILLTAGMIFYPVVKKQFFSVGDEAGEGGGVPSEKSLDVEGEVLEYRTLTDKTMCIGHTMADEEVDLSFEGSGKITGVYFKEGTHVNKGELLAKINDKPLLAELQKLEAGVPLASDRVYRQGALLEKDAVSREAYEQVSTEYAKLMADIELVKTHISQTELRAPFDGIIGLRAVSEGAYVTPSTMIARLTRICPLKIEFTAPERYVPDMQKGTKIVFRLDDADGVSQEYEARIYAVESKLDPMTHTLKARALYANGDEELHPGRFVSVEITRKEISRSLAVPGEAIIPEMGKNIVYVYKGGGAQAVEIMTGIRTESHVQAVSGLSVGDTVITTGVMQLRSGMKVSIRGI